MGAGVAKSGSPISRWMMSRPAASSACARARMSITWNGSMPSMRAAMRGSGTLGGLQPGQRMLAVELLQLAVDRRIFGVEQARRLEERFGRHREKLAGIVRGVGIDGGDLAGVDAAAQIRVGRAEIARPGGGIHAAMQRRIAVGVAVQH